MSNPPASGAVPSAGTGGSPRPELLHRSARTFVPIIAVLAVMAAAASWGLARLEVDAREQAGNGLETVLEMADEALQIWVTRRVSDAAVRAGDPRLVSVARRQLARARSREFLLAGSALAEFRVHIAPTLVAEGDLGASLIAPDHVTIASTWDQSIGSLHVIARDRPQILDRVFAGESLLVPPIRSDMPVPDAVGRVAAGNATLFLVSPIQHESMTVAALAVQVDINGHFLENLRLARIGETGETYAFDGDGRLLTESRFRGQLRSSGELGPEEQEVLSLRVSDPGGNMIEGFRPSLEREDQPLTLMAQSAIAGERRRNVNGYRDYRGVMVLGAWLWNESVGLGLTTEIDAQEALGPYRATRAVVIGLFTAAVLLTAALALLVSRVQRRARAALATSLRRYQQLLESANDGVLVMKGDVFTSCNARAIEILRRSRGQIIGQTPVEISPPLQPDGTATIEAVSQAVKRLNAGEPQMFNWRCTRGDGSEVDLELSLSPFPGGTQEVFCLMRDVTDRKAAEAEIERNREQLKELSRGLLDIQEKERRRLSRELHDDFGQALTAVKLNLQSIHRRSFDPPTLKAVADGIQIVDQTLAGVRSMAVALRPSVLDDLGLLPAIRSYVRTWSERANIVVELREDLEHHRLPAEIETTCFRVIQEALTNVARHAGTCSVAVTLKSTASELSLEVVDDGPGFDLKSGDAGPIAPGHLGLVGMRERVATVGGEFSIESAPDQGVRIRAQIPLSANADSLQQ